ncbi:MAG: ParB/RepB/Spo0J family partition protein [Lachnospiraceae bacterium]|nr:ParB/RepB/Spo0J family partition protein [Lachnospiraceae bacterium]MBQ8634312.1 ParB/RepB/Spo0J family partition protein [Lachnospiraceae bacterium]
MAAKKRGLGLGLDSLITDKSEDIETVKKETKENVSRETFLPLIKIEPNRAQPRTRFDEDALQELADSIKQYGIIEPIVVQKREDHYEIIAGERRWRAARIAGLKEVPVVVKEYSEDEIFTIALIENIQREDLNPIEEAVAYQKLIQELKLKQDEVAEKVSKSRTAITNSMRLLKLDQRVQQMLIDEMISEGHGRALLPITDPEEQFTLAMKVFDEKLSVRETEKLIKKLQEEKNAPVKQEEETKDVSFVYKSLEEKLKRTLGTKVEIKNKANNTGKIEIEYYSMDELERIVELMDSLQ